MSNEIKQLFPVCKICTYSIRGALPGQIQSQLMCRRFPPVLIVMSPGNVMSIFPMVQDDMSCGESVIGNQPVTDKPGLKLV